jgi:hypothetical protein
MKEEEEAKESLSEAKRNVRKKFSSRDSRK